MPDRRKAHLDALERRLTGPKRIALFGHRAVGKTTLLAMFYREASTGRVPGVRLAATDPASAEYLAEKIAQIEAGQPPAGTLAETELKLRLYHGPGRLDLIVKDYQGEHVTLGAEDRSIHAFFADCDAVLLCLDPDGAAAPADRRRRQQEVECLLERYIERSDDATTDRPVALLVTKYDRVLAQGGPPPGDVGRLVEAQYGMTAHALAGHAPRSALFAVSSYGWGAGEGGRPPAELHPLGLEGPLGWLAEQLEARDLELLEWLWDLAPDDLTRLARCVRAFEKRYPKSDRPPHYRERLKGLRRRLLKRNVARLTAAAGLLAGAAVGYDAWGYRRAVAFERDNPAPAVARRWAEVLAWHPALPLTWPGFHKSARHKLAEWRVKDAGLRVAVGADEPATRHDLATLKIEAPDLAPSIRAVELAREQVTHDRTWRGLRAEAQVSDDRPERQLVAIRSFLREYPDSPHRAEAIRLAAGLGSRLADRQARLDLDAVETIRRAATLPDADFAELIRQAQDFLTQHPESRQRADARHLQDELVARLDERDIEKARQFSKQHPGRNFAARIARYQGYLEAHRSGGRAVREAMDAQARIAREWDAYDYRLAFDHATAHPDDVAEVARRLRGYLVDHTDGRFVADAKGYVTWFERVASPHGYRVTLRRGEVEPEVGKYLSGGAPDLSVEVWVGGVKYGPSPTIPNSHRPNWGYTFPRPVVWKLNDPVVVRILDNDWSTTGVFTIKSRPGEPLAMRNLSGTVKPSKGGRTFLEFASDFAMPRLGKPD